MRTGCNNQYDRLAHDDAQSRGSSTSFLAARKEQVQKNRSFDISSGSFHLDAPTEIRTPVSSLKGWRPSPLDDGGEYSGRILSSTPRSGQEQERDTNVNLEDQISDELRSPTNSSLNLEDQISGELRSPRISTYDQRMMICEVLLTGR